MKLDAAQHTLAQGVALSVTSGTLQPLQEGSWPKRPHPGWAGASGITAAAFARSGYVGPAQAYEGRFGLNEIEAPSYTDAQLLKLAHKVSYEIDPNPGFPKSRSGEVIVKMKDGRELRCRDNILPDEPASAEAIVGKFMHNTDGILPRARAERVREAVLGIERVLDGDAFVRTLGKYDKDFFATDEHR